MAKENWTTWKSRAARPPPMMPLSAHIAGLLPMILSTRATRLLPMSILSFRTASLLRLSPRAAGLPPMTLLSTASFPTIPRVKITRMTCLSIQAPGQPTVSPTCSIFPFPLGLRSHNLLRLPHRNQLSRYCHQLTWKRAEKGQRGPRTTELIKFGWWNKHRAFIISYGSILHENQTLIA